MSTRTTQSHSSARCWQEPCSCRHPPSRHPAPLTAPAIPGVAALPGPLAAPATTSADHEASSRRRPTSGSAGTTLHARRLGPRRRTRTSSIVWNTANVTWVVDARARQRRLPRTQGRQDQRRPRAGEDRRAGRVHHQRCKHAEGLRRHPRHLRRRRRRAGREGRLPDRPHRDDDAEEGADRDDGHAHVLRPRLVALRGRRVAAVRQPLRRRRSWRTGRAASRRCSSAHPAPSAGTRSRSPTRSASTTSTSRSRRSRGRPGTASRSPSRRTPGLPKQRIDWPVSVAPTLDAKTTLAAAGVAARQGHGDRSAATSRAGPLEGRRLRERPDAERARQPRVVDGRRQPRQLHGHVLERSSPSRSATGTAAPTASLKSNVQVPDGLGGWHVIQLLQGGDVKAQVPYFVKRSVARHLVAQGQGRPALHHPSQGRRLDAARQHDRRRLRQQLHRLRLRVQLQRRRRPEPGRDGRAGHAPDRHVPAALHAAAVVREHAVRDGARADVRARRPGPRARLPAAGDPPGDRGRQVGISAGGRQPSSAESARERRNGALRLLRKRRRAGRGPGGAAARSLLCARALDAVRAAVPLARARLLARRARRRCVARRPGCRRTS